MRSFSKSTRGLAWCLILAEMLFWLIISSTNTVKQLRNNIRNENRHLESHKKFNNRESGPNLLFLLYTKANKTNFFVTNVSVNLIYKKLTHLLITSGCLFAIILKIVNVISLHINWYYVYCIYFMVVYSDIYVVSIQCVIFHDVDMLPENDYNIYR